MRAASRWISGALVLPAVLVASSCLFPDRDIRFLDSELNEHAVRFIESVPITIQDRCDCSDGLGITPTCEDLNDPDDQGLRCPIPPLALLPRFMDPEAFDGFDFCGCPDGEQDSRALPPIDDIWVEDLDTEDGAPKDSLYAAILLDLPNDPTADSSEFVAYRNLLNPDATLQIETNPRAVIPNGDKLARPEAQIRRVVMGNPSTNAVDFCNDAGTGVGALSEGWHTITLIVTDRPWVTISSDDPDSELPDIIKHGVPDVASHATWATRQWSFHCTDVENNADCQCEPPS